MVAHGINWNWIEVILNLDGSFVIGFVCFIFRYNRKF